MLLAIDYSGTIQATVAVVTVVTGVIVYLFQRWQMKNSRFNNCTSSLQTGSEEAQITSAILLRSFLTRRGYKTDALNLISALLRVTPYGNLQKTLGDSLSCVKHADGMDFQHINLHAVSIKSPRRIKDELAGKTDKRIRQWFRRADFFRADITESSICSVDFDSAIFYDTLLCSTAFHDCSFRGANFRDADLTGVHFDNCILDGVDFSGALHLDRAKVTPSGQPKGQEMKKKPLLSFLDENGKYDKYHGEPVYAVKSTTPKVFLSHLGYMDAIQASAMRDIKGWLESTHQIAFNDISRDDYRDSGQLQSIRSAMSKCCGVVIMAFSYMSVDSGSIHENKGNKACQIKDVSFSSPWLQIEAAMARSLGLPCLVFVQKGVQHNGYFDKKLVQNDGGMYMIDYQDTTLAFSMLDKIRIEDWSKAVNSRAKAMEEGSGDAQTA